MLDIRRRPSHPARRTRHTGDRESVAGKNRSQIILSAFRPRLARLLERAGVGGWVFVCPGPAEDLLFGFAE